MQRKAWEKLVMVLIAGVFGLLALAATAASSSPKAMPEANRNVVDNNRYDDLKCLIIEFPDESILLSDKTIIDETGCHGRSHPIMSS